MGLALAKKGKKNRVNQPEDDRETRGISNEYNVGLRRTPVWVCTKIQTENVKIKEHVQPVVISKPRCPFHLALVILNHNS